MKNLKILKQLNELLAITYEVESIYNEAFGADISNGLKNYFRKHSNEANKFGKELRIEIEKIKGKPGFLGKLSSDFYKISTTFRSFLFLQNENDLLNEVYEIKYFTIKAYDDLLIKLDLPLSLCKLLVKHRDRIQESLSVMKREHMLVA